MKLFNRKGKGILFDPLTCVDKNHVMISGSTGEGKSAFLQMEADRQGIPYDELLARTDHPKEGEPVDTRDKTLVEISPKYKLERYLINDAIDELSWTGIKMTESQMVQFLLESGIGTRILDYDKARV